MPTTEVILIDSNPTKVVSAEVGTLFIREGETFYVRHPNGVVEKLPAKYKPKDFNRVAYKNSTIFYKTQHEIWEKVSGGSSNLGWQFVSYRKYFTEALIVPPGPTSVPTATPLPPTPTATVEPTPTATAEPTPTPEPTPEPTSGPTQYLLNVDPAAGHMSSSINDQGYFFSGPNNDYSFEYDYALQFAQVWEVFGTYSTDSTGSKMTGVSSSLLGTVDLVASGSTNVDITEYILAKSPDTSSALVFTLQVMGSSEIFNMMSETLVSNSTLSTSAVRVGDAGQLGVVDALGYNSNIARVNKYSTEGYYGSNYNLPASLAYFTQKAVAINQTNLIGKQATFTMNGMYSKPVDSVLPLPMYTVNLTGLSAAVTGGLDSTGIGYSNIYSVMDSIDPAIQYFHIRNYSTGAFSGGVYDVMFNGPDSDWGYSIDIIQNTSSVDITSAVMKDTYSNIQNDLLVAHLLTAGGSSNDLQLTNLITVSTSSAITIDTFEADNLAGLWPSPLQIVTATDNSGSVNFVKKALFINGDRNHGQASFVLENPYASHPVMLPTLPPM